MDDRGHWQSVYTTKSPDSVSWFQAEPIISQSLITEVASTHDARIIDVGGGASTLVDSLDAAGFTALTVLDLAPAALQHARERMGAAAAKVNWIAGDVLNINFAPASFDIWHDRAVFHFLTQPDAKARYLAQVRRALRPGGHVVIATFAEDGPSRCSGLDVARYSAQELRDTFGDGFALTFSQREEHLTPTGVTQIFTYCVCRWSPNIVASRAV